MKQDEPQRKTTLKDVAKACSVSPMTVSKMLNGKSGVSKETARRIWAAIRKLNYTPNLIAKSLRINKTRTFGLVISDSSDLLFPKMIQGVIDAAAAADYNVIIANTNHNQKRETEFVRVLLNKRIDGMLLAAPFDDSKERIREIESFGIPVVLLMRTSILPVDFIASANFQGGYDIVTHLIRQGERDIHFINLPRDHHNGEERRIGHRQAMLDHDLEYAVDDAIFAKPEIQAGYEAMRQLLARGVQAGSVVCGCDIIAIGAIKAALDAGLSIPGDMKITGYDDIEMLDYLNVPLTTMRQQVNEMGHLGVAQLLARMAQPDLPPVQSLLPCELIVRKST